MIEFFNGREKGIVELDSIFYGIPDDLEHLEPSVSNDRARRWNVNGFIGSFDSE